MSLAAGTRIGPYDIGEPIGVGGMGEVYRATDTNLKRSVAVKVLPASVALDADRLARFQREAEVIAALNHPNIAAIYGFEKAGAITALVLELVEGPTLADRIAQGPLPIDETLAIARQIAAAVAAAHEQNIVHRDLKPSNIKVRPDGTVKVLDFGLAKAIEGTAANAGAPSSSLSPTITTPAMTQAGVILGTAAYMSPEQARGRPVDRRSDVWAFACVVYEMLTGRRAFDGEDVTETIAAVVRGEPDWQALPASTPAQIRLMLKRGLAKDRRERLADISVAIFLMTETIDAVARPSVGSSEVGPGRGRLVRAGAIGLACGALLAGGAVWARFASAPRARQTPVRFALVPPAESSLFVTAIDHDVALSPDGTRLVYRSSAAGGARLAVRSVQELDARPLEGTNSARNPFLSPDGEWVGFFVGNELRKVPIGGGPPTAICRFSTTSRGASWGDDGVIVFATVDGALMQVASGGGEAKPLMPAGPPNGEVHSFPHVLPGSGAVVFTSRKGRGGEAQVDVVDRRTGQRKTLVKGGTDASYADGYLVFVAGSEAFGERGSAASLRAVRFDVRRLELAGDPVPVLDSLAAFPTGAANYTLSRNGTLVYVRGDARLLPQNAPRTLTWVNRQGREDPMQLPPRSYAVARISPDGTRVALDIRDQMIDIWVLDVNRNTLTPLSRNPAQDMSPVWTPDGRRIIWTSTRGGGNPNLFWQDASGTGSAERLTTNDTNQFPTSMTPDGSHVVLFGGGARALTIYTVPMAAQDRKAIPLLEGAATFYGGEISPDGRWLAYHSNESGEFQVFVRPYPNVDAGRWQISTNGGTRAVWARSGRELFYLDAQGCSRRSPSRLRRASSRRESRPGFCRPLIIAAHRS